MIRATEGYIGRLDEILREAAIASLSRGYKKVEEFASECGVVFSTVNRWEKGHTRPSPMALKLIILKLESMGESGQKLFQQYQC